MPSLILIYIRSVMSNVQPIQYRRSINLTTLLLYILTKKMNVRLINDFSHKKAQRFHFTLSSNFSMHVSLARQLVYLSSHQPELKTRLDPFERPSSHTNCFQASSLQGLLASAHSVAVQPKALWPEQVALETAPRSQAVLASVRSAC